MKRMKMRAMLALSVALSVAGLAQAGVVDKVPAEALVVWKVSNLTATNAKVGKLATKLGVTFFLPWTADPLAIAKKEMKITAGLQEDGEAAIVMVDPKGGRPDKSILFLVPTNDFKALVGGLQGATTEGALTVLNVDGKPVYIADWGGYAAGSQNKDLVAAAPSQTLKLTGRSAEEWNANDLCLFANVNALREPLTAQLNKAHEEASRDLPNDLKDNAKLDEKYHPAAMAAMDQAFGVAEAFLRDADAATIGLSLSDPGIKYSVVAAFKPDSYLAKTVNSIENTDATLLANLPVGAYLMYAGFKNSPASIAKLIDDVSGPIIAKLPADDENAKLVPSYIADVKKLMAQVKGGASALLTPQGVIGQDPIIQAINVAEVEGNTLMTDVRAFTEKYSAITNELMAAGNSGAQFTQTHTAGAKVIDGVSFDLMSTQIAGEGASAEQARQGFKMMYGSDRLDQYMAQVDNKVISFMGVPDDAVSSLITAAKAGQAPLAALETVKPISAQLSKKRFAEVYIAVDEIFNTGIRAANQFGPAMGMPAINVTLPPDLEPVGVSIGSNNGSLEVTTFISSDLVQSLVSASLQIGMQMNGGGGGQNNGGL